MDKKIDFSNIEEYQLENNMNILIAPNYDNPIVYIYMYLKIGSLEEQAK